MLAAIQFPSWLKPQIFPFWPNFPVRWYGVMYLVAFFIAYLLFRYQVRQKKLGYSDDEVSSFFMFGIVGLIVGARIFGTLLYDPDGMYWRKPWLIFWPFDANGRFSGFAGMSFHGGVVGGFLGMLTYCLKHKRNLLEWTDLMGISIPLGYTFGRLGNFINGELWGKVSTAPWSMVFPNAKPFPADQPWVREIMEKTGILANGGLANLPRHPSQLYEALFEGIVLGLLLWFTVRKKSPFHGFATGTFLAGYGFIRFILEYFREPDESLGYIIKFGDPDASIHLFSTPFNFSMGQLLCFLMIVTGVGLIAILSRAEKNKASLFAAAEAERAKLKQSRKKLRRK